MKVALVKGTTSYIAQVFIQDSGSITGAGLAGLVYNSGSLTAYYHRDTDTTATVMTLVTMTVGTWTSLGFKEIDATNMPGWYQLGIPNACLATGAKSCAIHLKGATNMAPLPIEIELTGVDTQDAMRGGMTALPNQNAEAAGGLYTRGSGAGQLSQSANGELGIATLAKTLTTYTGNTPQTADNNTKLADLQTRVPAALTAGGNMKAGVQGFLDTVFTEGAAGRIAAAFKQFFNIATPAATMDDGILVDTVTTTTTATNVTNAPTAGDLTATMKASVTTAATAATPIAASVTGAVGSVTGNVGGNVTGSVGSVVGAVGSVTGNVGGNVTGSVGSVVGAIGDTRLTAIKASTDNLPSDPADESLIIAATDAIMTRIGAAGAGLTALGDTRIANLDATVSSRATPAQVLTQVNAALDTILAAAIPAVGTRPTLRQGVYMTTQFLLERTVAGILVTVKNPDGSTLLVLTLGDATSPLSITRTA